MYSPLDQKSNLNNTFYILFKLLQTALLAYILCTYLRLNYSFSATLGLVFFTYTSYNNFKNLGLKVSVLFVGLFVCLGILCANILDISFDGLSYHQNLINHLLTQKQNITFQISHPSNLEDMRNPNIWNAHFTTAVEGSQAFFAWLLGSVVDAGKVFQFVLLAFTAIHLLRFLIYYKIFRNQFQNYIFLFSVLSCPVIVTQQFTFLIDGCLHLAVINFFIFCVSIIIENKMTWKHCQWFVYFLYMSINTKASGVFFVLTIILFFILILIYKNNFLAFCKAHFSKMLFAVFIVITLSTQPYFTNYINHKTLIYPSSNFTNTNETFGPNWIQPKHFPELHPMQKSFYSFFGYVSNLTAADSLSVSQPFNDELKIKIPFWSNAKEWLCFYRYEVRKNGFGPYFSGFIFFSIILFVFVLVNKKIETNEKKILSLFYGIIFLIPFLFLPVNFFARYQATLWWIVPFTFYLLFQYFNIKTLEYFLITMLTIQTILIASINYGRTFIESYVLQESIRHINNNKDVYYYNPASKTIDITGLKFKIKNSQKEIFNMDTVIYNFININPTYMYLAMPKKTDFKLSAFSSKILEFKNAVKNK